MKKNQALLWVLFLVLTGSIPTFAAETTTGVKDIKTTQDRITFNKETTDKMKADVAYRKEAWGKSFDLMKQMSDLNRKRASTKDPEELKKLTDQVVTLQSQIEQLNEEIAQRDVTSAEFSIKIARDRLERAKKRLADIQEKKKKKFA